MKKTASLPLVKNPLKYIQATLSKMENHPQLVEKGLPKKVAEKCPSQTQEKCQSPPENSENYGQVAITEQQKSEEIKIEKIGKFLIIIY
jgi:hypothetical protein